MTDAAAVGPQLVLASRSPRRAALLGVLGLRVHALPAEIDETPRGDEAPLALVQRLATTKALRVSEQIARPGHALAGLPVLGADTIVVLDALVLGKPIDRADGLAMLAALSGRSHEVFTAVAVAANTGIQVRVSRSVVRFRSISSDEAERYWATDEPRDKAGGYGIQGIGGIFVERLEGSHSGVMGLPVAETEALLRGAGVDCWRHRTGDRSASKQFRSDHRMQDP